MTRPDVSDDEMRMYHWLVAEMDSLRALPDLSYTQADRWASLSNARLLLYAEPPGWTYKAVARLDGRWELVQMWMRGDMPLRSEEWAVTG